MWNLLILKWLCEFYPKFNFKINNMTANKVGEIPTVPFDK